MTTKKVFETWLNRQDALHEWFRELKVNSVWRINYNAKTHIRRSIIDVILTWRSTTQGEEYWGDLDTKWEEYYDSIN